MRRGVVSFLVVFFLMVTAVFAASYQCKEYSSRKGKVDGVVVDFGTVIYTDGSAGWKTYIKWPGKFDVPDIGTTWDKNNIHTPGGTIQVKLRAKLSGTRKYGIWHKRHNVITVQLIRDGEVVAEKSIDKNVARARYFTITLPAYSPGESKGTEIQYKLRIKFDKRDGASGDDGVCEYGFVGIVD